MKFESNKKENDISNTLIYKFAIKKMSGKLSSVKLVNYNLKHKFSNKIII